MNIQNLTEGQIFKNYKLLCEALGIKPTTGEAKQNQMKLLSELVDYHKEGNKIIIDKIKVVGNNYVLRYNSNKELSKSGVVTTTFDNKTIDKNKYYISKEEDELFDTIDRNKFKLNIGTTYTYKKLTEILEIPNLKGNPKEAQIRVIRQLINLEKKDSKYKVVSIYKIPLQKDLANVDNISADTYGNMLLLALYKYVVINDCKDILNSQGYLFFSRQYLYQAMEMCNADYKNFKHNKKDLAEVAQVDLETIHRFYDYNESLFKSNLSKATRNLRSRRIAKIDDDALCIVTRDKDGNDTYRLATEKEFSLIQDIEKRVLKIMDYTDMRYVYANHEIDKFYKISVKLIKKEIYNKNPEFKSFGYDFHHCYRVIKVNTLFSTLQMGYDELLNKIRSAMKLANKLVLEKNDNYFSVKAKALSDELLPRGVFGRDAINQVKMEFALAFLDEINVLKQSLLLIEKEDE